MSKLIIEAITEYYGERCPDYDEDCFCCKVWSEYDALTSPARCDELKTAARVSTVFMDIETFAGDFIRGRLKSGDILVTRQNAEEVIAAERLKLEATARVGLQLSEQIEALEADNKRLREALEPFAEIAELDIGEDETDIDLYRPMGERNAAARLIRIGDLRRASAVLGEVKP